MTARRKKPMVEVGSGNVFADLGFENAEEELARAELVFQLVQTIRRLGLTQVKASRLLGVDQPTISKLVRGRLERFSTERLLRFLTMLGNDVRIVVRPKRGGHSGGRLIVDAA